MEKREVKRDETHILKEENGKLIFVYKPEQAKETK